MKQVSQPQKFNCATSEDHEKHWCRLAIPFAPHALVLVAAVTFMPVVGFQS